MVGQQQCHVHFVIFCYRVEWHDIYRSVLADWSDVAWGHDVLVQPTECYWWLNECYTPTADEVFHILILVVCHEVLCE